MSTPPSASPSQGKRRAVYGVNVAVAIAVALLLLLLVNWFAVWAFARVAAEVPGARPWLRYDLTATRTHTLSPQTRRVLDQLDAPLELIGIYPDGSPEAQAVTDLLGEYRRSGAGVSVRTLDPGRDFAVLRDLLREIESGSGDVAAMDELRAAVEQGMTALDELAATFDGLLADFENVADKLDPDGMAGASVLDGYMGTLAKWVAQCEDKAALLRQLLDEPLPPLAEVRSNLGETLRVTRSGWLSQLDRELGRTGRDNLLPPAVRDAALRAQRELPEVGERVDAAVSALSLSAVDPEYQRLRAVVAQSAFVLVRSAGRVRVVSLRDMFVAEAPGGMTGGADGSMESTAAETLPVRFLGEERLTGAVVSVGLAHPPRLVFVSGDGRPVLGQGGQFNYVAERVRASGFEVGVWRVVDEAGGATLNPPPKVDPAAGRTVWVVLPMDPSKPTDAAAKALVASALRERSDAGDGVLLIPALRVDAAYAAADPLLAWAAHRGVGVDVGAVVLRPSPQDGSAAENTFRQESWPDHVVTRPLKGRTVWFDLAHPIVPPSGKTDIIPLVTLSVEGMWVEREPLAAGDLSRSRPGGDERVLAQVVAAAVESAGPAPGGRLAVVADDFWATDTVILRRRAGGNAELFANLAYWLGGLEAAIDLTPRSQGRRRIGPISTGGRTTVRWLLLAGVPTISLLAGVGVWLVRRRG